jgi:hypothetical protein
MGSAGVHGQLWGKAAHDWAELQDQTHEGQVYCLLEATNAEAVREHHAALGVPCGVVHQFESLL